MAKLIQRNFTGGEVALTLISRDDLAKRSSSCWLQLNFISQLHGAAVFRPGTAFVGESLGAGVYIPFEFNTEAEDKYSLDFTDLKMQVIQGDGYVMDGPFRVEINTPFLEEHLEELSYAQIGDLLYLAHAQYGAYILTRTNHTMWSLAAASFGTLQVAPTSPVAAWTGRGVPGPQSAPSAPYVVWNGSTPVTPQTYRYVVTAVSEDGYESEASPSDSVEVETPFSGAVNISWAAVTGAVRYKVYRSSLGTSGWFEYIGGTTGLYFTEIAGMDTVEEMRPPTTTSANGFKQYYKISAVNSEGVESVGTDAFGVGAYPSAEWKDGDVIDLQWAAAAGATEYNVYKAAGGVYGLIGIATDTEFRDDNITPDPAMTPQVEQTPFATENPNSVGFHQQRLWLGVMNRLHGSRTGDFNNFNKSTPLRDDDALEFPLFSKKINEIKWMIPFSELFVGTAGAEHPITGGDSDSITPTNILADPRSYWGSNHLAPILVGNSVLHVTRQGNAIRDLFYSLEKQGFQGNDLSVLANHLFDGHTITSWAYQQTPHSVIWAVRDDGVLLGMTYLKEHEVWGWHQHQTAGVFKSVCVVEGGTEDTVYFRVVREVGGSEVYYTETLKPRWRADQGIDSAFYVDSGLTYDGFNSDPNYQLRAENSGSGWGAGEDVTVRATGFTPFDPASVGKRYRLIEAGESADLLITAYISSSEVTAQSSSDIPAELQVGYTSEWAVLASTVSGADHLEGKDVVALADGSPVSGLTVTAGEVDLGSDYFAKIHVGLSYLGVLAPLPFEAEIPNVGTTQGTPRGFGEVSVRLHESVGGRVGAASIDTPVEDVPTDRLTYATERWGHPIAPFSGVQKVEGIGSAEERDLTVYVVQDAPLPLTVLSIIADIDYGD